MGQNESVLEDAWDVQNVLDAVHAVPPHHPFSFLASSMLHSNSRSLPEQKDSDLLPALGNAIPRNDMAIFSRVLHEANCDPRSEASRYPHRHQAFNLLLRFSEN